MADFTHTHPLHPRDEKDTQHPLHHLFDQEQSHVDNTGQKFGADEHGAIAADDVNKPHDHANVFVRTHPETQQELLYYRPNAKEGEGVEEAPEFVLHHAEALGSEESAAPGAPKVAGPGGVSKEIAAKA